MLINFFSKGPIPDKLPESAQRTINELKKCKNKQECLKSAYNIVTKKYVGYRMKTYTHLHELFTMNFYDIWKRKGFLHCHYMNYVLQVLLIKSRHFSDKDIQQKWTLVWYVSPHQYLRINTGEKIINVDLWGATNKVEFGDYAYGFN